LAQSFSASIESEPLPSASPGGRSSRRDAADAGWTCNEVGTYRTRLPHGDRPFSWLNPVPLWQARNDRVARWFGDPTNDVRRAWVRQQLAQGVAPDFVVGVSDPNASQVSFVVLSDTGEGDGSQYAVAPVLERAAGDTAFMVICSDVIYPAGGVSEYEDKFYRPYSGYPAPIYGAPGNHDWYDDLTGFMLHFCGVDPKERPPNPSRPGGSSRRLLRFLFWRRPRRASTRKVDRMKALRPMPKQVARLPGPYYALDAGPILLVAIDTGIIAGIDRDQGDWLRRISSASEKPKILLTGKPLYVDGQYRPCCIEGGGTVDDIVRVPSHNYVAVIGGDIHNYQRYPVTLADGRTIQHVVNGGGGAFLHATHKIPNIDWTRLPGVTESEFRCYPLRGDSLSMFSKVYTRRLRFLVGDLFIPPNEAAALMAERLGIEPTRQAARRTVPSVKSRRALERVFPRADRAPGFFDYYFSEFFDWNDPPMFKSFLRVDAGIDRISLTCFGATGCLEDERDPPVEDVVVGLAKGEGRWSWETVT
jgi:hypothetical protein